MAIEEPENEKGRVEIKRLDGTLKRRKLLQVATLGAMGITAALDPLKVKAQAPPIVPGPMGQFLDMYGKTVDAMMMRLKTIDAFSPDLSASVAPTLVGLGVTKDAMMNLASAAFSKAPAEEQAALNQQIPAAAVPLLQAGIAAAQVPVVPAPVITLSDGARQIPWLDFIKELLAVLLPLIPGIPPFLSGLFSTILKLIDKLFSGISGTLTQTGVIGENQGH